MNFSQLLSEIVSDLDKHARWLNTLSLMENSGARKISASEHKKEVTLIILKHAAEEHRHAFYLKKQISKLTVDACPTYADQYVFVCKYLKSILHLSGNELKFAAYLLVTYAIEVRADELYPIYQEVLDKAGSKVNVKSIILEEEGHLEEMLTQLKNFSPDWQKHADKAVEFETKLFNDWVKSLENEI